jgi:hypothetical protein
VGKHHTEIDDSLRTFLAAQHVFFVATAPSGDGGHVNCSPKGLDTFRVLGPTTVAYADFTGSGVETIAHLRQNGRIVILFCAFDGEPRIVRLHGRGTAVEPRDPEFAPLLERFGRAPLGIRSVIRVEVARIADSCGFGVPRFAYEGEREQLTGWNEAKGPAGVEDYQRRKNARSLDGLPGLRWVDADRA